MRNAEQALESFREKWCFLEEVVPARLPKPIQACSSAALPSGRADRTAVARLVRAHGIQYPERIPATLSWWQWPIPILETVAANLCLASSSVLARKAVTRHQVSALSKWMGQDEFRFSQSLPPDVSSLAALLGEENPLQWRCSEEALRWARGCMMSRLHDEAPGLAVRLALRDESEAWSCDAVWPWNRAFSPLLDAWVGSEEISRRAGAGPLFSESKLDVRKKLEMAA
ncbi:hypothetical protein SAMN06265795_11422 [Noviherbaspirillum humi]|uniref:Uncharacterized protein n=1 Tax=Noviherbaspirillum humi TaxID=1688639 RepID=A0A239K073_9BURK|nr:hypothetical protein [Noviherbaspirillum humi]SNT10444.1 hypothetical protein SAMN06265795_11422 [Noviherbaspirillum humi]